MVERDNVFAGSSDLPVGTVIKRACLKYFDKYKALKGEERYLVELVNKLIGMQLKFLNMYIYLVSVPTASLILCRGHDNLLCIVPILISDRGQRHVISLIL